MENKNPYLYTQLCGAVEVRVASSLATLRAVLNLIAASAAGLGAPAPTGGGGGGHQGDEEGSDELHGFGELVEGLVMS